MFTNNNKNQIFVLFSQDCSQINGFVKSIILVLANLSDQQSLMFFLGSQVFVPKTNKNVVFFQHTHLTEFG